MLSAQNLVIRLFGDPAVGRLSIILLVLASVSLCSECCTRDAENGRFPALGLVQKPNSVMKGDALKSALCLVVIMANVTPLW